MTLHAGRERISDSKNSCDALVSYSQDTRRSLAIADQAVINYDLLEAVVCAVVDQVRSPTSAFWRLPIPNLPTH